MRWARTEIKTAEGIREAIAPAIISASRATDIPAFHAPWLLRRLEQGYLSWRNPYNQRTQFVSFEQAKILIFWSKNPGPLIPFLPAIDACNLAYYFQFTLNDYEAEGLEPGLPPLRERIATFQRLSEELGKDRVLWRFDPLVLTETVTINTLLEKIKRVGDAVAPYTTKLIFSFADIERYRKVQRRLRRKGIAYREFSDDAMRSTALAISRLCKEWGITAATCGERIDLSEMHIAHNKCVDDELILKLTHSDPAIRQLFGVDESGQQALFESAVEPAKKIKDPGQREACGCVFSKDIGQYNTCQYGCLYCYANYP